MWNVRCLEKLQKFPLFLTKTGQKKFLWKISQHASQLDGAQLEKAKTSAFSSFLYSQYSKLHLFSSEKSPKIEIFIAKNGPKEISAAENLEYDRSGTRRSVYTNIWSIRPIAALKITFKEMERGMS